MPDKLTDAVRELREIYDLDGFSDEVTFHNRAECCCQMCDAYREAERINAILDALEAKDEQIRQAGGAIRLQEDYLRDASQAVAGLRKELQAARAVIDKYQTLQRLKGRPTSTQWGKNANADEIRAENSQYQRVVDQTLQDYLAEYGEQGTK
jgi:hypothetical protein